MITIDGELVDGFHVESIPQFNTDDAVDMNALSSLAGIRAIWLLYIAGKWDHLEDLGVNRAEVEPVIQQCCTHYSRRLTVRQAQQLQKKVPALKEASVELRLAYALKSLDRDSTRVADQRRLDRPKERKSKVDMVIYHAEVDSGAKAKEVVKTHAAQIEAAGGSIEAGFGRGQNGAIVMVKLPAEPPVDPANILPTSGLKFSKVRAQVVAIPQNMGEDPRSSESEHPRRGGKANG